MKNICLSVDVYVNKCLVVLFEDNRRLVFSGTLLR